jgi:hypothetical protein
LPLKDFWIKSSYKYFESVNNPNEFDRKSLIELIPKIKPYGYWRNWENIKKVFNWKIDGRAIRGGR